MKTMGRFLRIGVILAMAMAALPAGAPSETSAPVNNSIFTRPLVWRAGSSAGYSFENISLVNTELASDGSVVSGASQGACELLSPCKTDGPVTKLSASWSFTGKVTLQVSVTGSSKDYIDVTNGVPVIYKEPDYGSKIKWRAALAPGSALTELKITYSDLSGVVGSFGESSLSGFGVRKEIYIKGSSSGRLFNYQMPIKAGESQKSPAPYDVRLDGGILSGFADIRFTQADGETILPHYLESVTGKAPDRTALFWVRIPEIPEDGLLIYVYYAKAGALDLSSGEKVFDFFDDFQGSLLDKKWTAVPYDKTSRIDIKDSILSLERAKVVSTDYKFAGGLIEYKARASANGASALIIRAASSGDDDVIAYSSVSSSASEHSIAKGAGVKANDPKPIYPDFFYIYKIYRDDNGDIAFRRYGEDGSGAAQAETEYSAGIGDALPIGLFSAITGETMGCDWIRTRKAANPPPQIDTRTASAPPEATNLPEFYNVSTSPDGSIIPDSANPGGYYISRLISPGFDARIIRPSWESDLEGEEGISVSIAVKNGGKFYSGWASGVARYASKKEFDKGSQLRWKAEFIGQGSGFRVQGTGEETGLKKFGLEYRPGTIRVIMPRGGETLVPGASYIIFWEASGYDPKYPMEIAYYTAGRDNFRLIASKTDNSGDYTWSVPKKASSRSLVKVSDYYDKAVYGISEDYFSIGTAVSGEQAPEEVKPAAAAAAPAEEPKAEEIPAPEKKSLEGYYDLLIKVGDNPSPDGYKDGDVVMVKPAGFLWGAEEKSKFFLVRVRLNSHSALELIKPDESVTIAGKSNNKVTKVLKRRKYRFNLRDKITLQERAAASQGHLTGRPLELSNISGMTERK